MLLSLLDRSRTRTGFDDASALRHTVERAVHAEQIGLHRFWVAEHHGVPGIASGAPAVLAAAVAARTSHIRVGSGGVMLPNHQPLIVAEQFLMLESLFPGRIDLGVGRSLGFTEPVRAALRSKHTDSDAFEAEIAELRSYLDGSAPVTARPAAGSPPVFVLATGAGLEVAARAGLPVVVGGPVLQLGDPLALYRKHFRPSSANPEPYVIVSLDVTIAADTADARRLAVPEAWAMARSRREGEFPPLEPPSHIETAQWTPQTRNRIEVSLESTILGTAEQVRPRLEELIERTGADEIMASTSTYDRAELFDADAAFAQLAGVAG
ncbi:putative alkanal monooxygenase [Rhodococcus sp. AW25M09]|uniref:MsnO8 family LLM class oxidoreductase n=1 Tax=Rhodococcus sp. AW25M09 TaxID=1268303 RepID=UPI0002ACF1A7|nr:MsnO8 family LLM class oxidoreductase [Rhodococcus sp. AW25M09]CCQ15259.1 putative alkanal monooxygenase [Rhodococcus sp. AW25M09]